MGAIVEMERHLCLPDWKDSLQAVVSVTSRDQAEGR